MRISENVRAAINEDGAVLMDIDQGQMFSINPAGSLIWQQLKDGRSSEEIAERFVTDFGISREQARTDVSEFVKQLEAQQLIRSSESENSRTTLSPRPKRLFGKLLQRWNPNARGQAPAR